MDNIMNIIDLFISKIIGELFEEDEKTKTKIRQGVSIYLDNQGINVNEIDNLQNILRFEARQFETMTYDMIKNYFIHYKEMELIHTFYKESYQLVNQSMQNKVYIDSDTYTNRVRTFYDLCQELIDHSMYSGYITEMIKNHRQNLKNAMETSEFKE
jgi:UDP-N-acetylglucosamine pyrophosphorylase